MDDDDPIGENMYEIFGNGNYEIKVASDPAVAKELIEESEDTDITLICDNQDLGSSFLSEVSEIKLRKIKTIMFVYPQDAIGDIRNSLEKFKYFIHLKHFLKWINLEFMIKIIKVC